MLSETLNKINPFSDEKKHTRLFFFLLIVGAFLRLFHLTAQPVGDDEWHAIYATFKPFSYIFTNFHIDDNCIPLSLYAKVILNSIGLTELTLRLPQIISGILVLILFPRLGKTFFKSKTNLIFLAFLSISPFIIFYSRFARPYIITFLLSFIAITFLWRAIQTNRKSEMVIASLAGSLACYFHLYAFCLIGTGIGFFVLHGIVDFFIKQKKKAIHKLKTLFFIFGLFALFTSLWFLPALPSFLNLFNNAWGRPIGFDTLWGSIQLLVGTSNPYLCWLAIGFFLFGSYRLFKKNLLLCLFFISLIFIQGLAIAISRPGASWSPIVVSRYFLPAWPFCLLLISFGLEGFIEKSKKSQKAILAILFMAYFFLGPIPRTYSLPNNFMNHSAYQEDYKKIDWSRSYLSDFEDMCHVTFEEIPEIYKNIAKDDSVDLIIEYPRIEMDHLKFYYYYQHFHKKNVKIGIKNDSLLNNFKNYVKVDSEESLLSSRAGYLVVHKTIPIKVKEPFPYILERIDRMKKEAKDLKKFLVPKFGKIVYEDAFLYAVKLKN